MLAAAIIVFREVLEAALIVGIVLAATRGLAGSRRWVLAGIGGGAAMAVVLAVFADALAAAFEGVGQEMFNAAVLIVAVAMLAWHNAWMARHGRAMASEMNAVGRAVASGNRPLWALAVVVGIAVLREGAETVLFLYGATAANQEGGLATALGFIGGLAAGVGVGGLLYFGLLAIPARALFAVTGGMVTLLAAGMAAQAVNYLIAAGLLDLALDPVWDSSGLLSESSLVGRLLHTLVGYVARPSLGQVLAWTATVVVITAAVRLLTPPAPPRRDRVASAPEG